MKKINMTIDIDRPVEEVFSALSDIRTQTQWDKGMIEGRHEPDGPAQLGTKMTEVRKFAGRTIETTSELVEFEANRKFVRKGGDNDSMSLTGILTFTPTDSGTHVNWLWELELSGPLSLMTPIMARQLRSSAEPTLEKLKQLLESGEFQPLN